MQSHKDFTVTPNWTNLLSSRSELSGKELLVQVVGSGSVTVIAGDFDPEDEDASDTSGLSLAHRDDLTVTAGTTALWARTGDSSTSKLSVTEL